MISNPVIIIGAGLSGLTAAYRLLQNGIDVHIYEARQRVGGRVLTAHLNDTIIELGAQNILDGGKAENIQRLITELNLSTEKGKINSRFHYLEGTELINIDDLLTQSQVLSSTNKLKQYLNQIAAHSQNMSEVLHALFPSHPILYKIFAIRLMGYEGLSVEKLSVRYVETLTDMLVKFKQSDESENRYYEYMLLQGGNTRLVDHLQKKLGDRVHLNRPLRSIGKGKTINGSYVLNFKGNHTVEAERVVLTIPCGVYKDIHFYPDDELHSRLSHIKKIAYGEHAKLFVPVPISPNFYGLYANDYFALFSMATPNIVTMYYLNNSASFIPETISQIFQRDRSFLETVYQQKVQKDAIYALDKHHITYHNSVGYNWLHDPYARGSYSCIAEGQEDILTSTTEYYGEKVKTLFSPIDHQIFFAGEHTSLINEIGTMEAAVESGERTARMIMLANK